MLFETEGIVLNYIKFKETSIITKIYTKDLGLKSFIVNSVRTPKKGKTALFQPLSLLYLVVYNKESVSLNRISEVKCIDTFKSLRSNSVKIYISFFLSELLTKSLKEENPDEELFEFLKYSLYYLENTEEEVVNYHLFFLVNLSKHLGFFTNSTTEILTNSSEKYITENERTKLEEILNSIYDSKISLTNAQRRKFLKILIEFYNYHIDNFGEINSVKILEEILMT